MRAVRPSNWTKTNESIHIVHVDLGKISTKCIPKSLNVDQKRARLEESRLLYARSGKSADLLSHVSNRWNGDTLVVQDLRNFLFKDLLQLFLLQLFGIAKRNEIVRTVTGSNYSTLLTTLRKKIIQRGRGKFFQRCLAFTK